MTLGKTQRRVLNLLSETPEQLETTEIQARLEISNDQCLAALKRLWERGFVMRVASGNQFRWTITPKDILACA